MSEGYTQVAPDSTGDKIRTNELTLLQAAGTRVSVSAQVISVADADGVLIGQYTVPLFVDSLRLAALLEELIDEVRKLRTVLELTQGINLD